MSGLVRLGAADYKPQYDTGCRDHYPNYFPGALIELRRRAIGV